MFHAEVGEKMTGFSGDTAIVVGAVTDEQQALRTALPLSRFQIGLPQIPVGLGFVGAIGIAMLAGKGDDRGGISFAGAEIVLEHRGFRRFDGTDYKICESGALG